MSTNESRLKAIEESMAALKAEAKALTPKKEHALSFKVQEKGTISIYGLQKFPVTLYPKQWAKVFKAMPELMKIVQPLIDAETVATVEEVAQTA